MPENKPTPIKSIDGIVQLPKADPKPQLVHNFTPYAGPNLPKPVEKLIVQTLKNTPTTMPKRPLGQYNQLNQQSTETPTESQQLPKTSVEVAQKAQSPDRTSAPKQQATVEPVRSQAHLATQRSSRNNPQPTAKKKSLLKKILTSNVAVILVAIAASFAFYDAQIGQYIIIALGVVALIARLDSRYIFGAALFMLVMIPVLTVFNRPDTAENYATYCFLLLFFGTIRSMFELRKQKA